jgi:hypothetical protein
MCAASPCRILPYPLGPWESGRRKRLGSRTRKLVHHFRLPWIFQPRADLVDILQRCLLALLVLFETPNLVFELIAGAPARSSPSLPSSLSTQHHQWLFDRMAEKLEVGLRCLVGILRNTSFTASSFLINSPVAAFDSASFRNSHSIHA